MITEDYVSFETAKLLKEKGFDEYCPLWYNLDKPLEGPFFYKEIGCYGHNSYSYVGCNIISAPTLQMAMKWLREEKDILISVNPTLDKDGFTCVMYYIWNIDDIETKAITSGLYSLEGYNECIEAAIKYCLENLI